MKLDIKLNTFKLGAVLKLLPILGISVTYAFCYTAIKFGLTYSPPLIFGGMRAFIGGLTLLIILIVLRRPFFPGRQEWRAIFLIGLVSTTLNFGAMFLSPDFIGAGIASVLGNLQPLIALLLAAIFLGERMTVPKITAMIFGLAGVILITFPAISGTPRYGIGGSLLALSISVSSAIGTILAKHLIKKANFLIFAAWQLIIGSLPLLAISILVEPVKMIAWTLNFFGILLFLALVGTSLVTAVWYWLLQNQEVGFLSLFLFLIPLFGLGIAALVFDERLDLLASIGVILILAGIGVIVSRKLG